MILEGHGKEWEFSEKPAIEQLVKMGYEYKTNKELNQKRDEYSEPLLLDRVKEAIKRINIDDNGNQWILGEDEAIQDAINQLRRFNTNVPLDANEEARAKFIGLSRKHLQPITVKLPGEIKSKTVKLFDFDNIDNNEFIVTNQFWMWGHKEYIYPDVMIFVNGIPLVLIECKAPHISNPLSEAIEKNLTKYQALNTGYEKLCYYNQILIITCGTQAKFAPSYADAHHFKEWLDPFPLTKEQVEEKIGKVRKQEILIAGMLDKQNLMELLRTFMVYDTKGSKRIKMIAKYQQFRSVQKCILQTEIGTNPLEKGGIIWHTPGAGKSLDMLWVAMRLKRKYDKPTVIVVTDRRQLDKQIHDTFVSCGFPSPTKADDRDDLREMIEKNKGKTIMTTIQKFPFFKEDEEIHAVSDEPLFVLVDESHRTNFGITAGSMREALPNAVFFAYTGTPILKKGKQKQWFGGYIDKYKLAQSEADEVTVPVLYESRHTLIDVKGESVEKVFQRIVKDLDEDTKQIAKKKYVNKTIVRTAEDRIRKNCLDILDHYEAIVQPNGLKAMIVAPSREAAVIYKTILDDMKAPESKIIMSKDPKDKEKGWEKYQLTSKEKEIVEDRFNLTTDEDGLSILIVVDMLLTGFDAPILQAIYLDKGLSEHSLLQAISRVNRNHVSRDGYKKSHGLIVDYWGISENLREAYQMYNQEDIAELEQSVKPLENISTMLKLYRDKLMNYFKDIENKKDLDAMVNVLEPDDVREEFNNDFLKFSKYMDMLLPDHQAMKYAKDLTLLSDARKAARNAFNDENLGLREIGAQVKKLILQSITASDTIKLIEPSHINNKNFMELLESYSSNRTKASMIECRARKVIDDEESKDPDFYIPFRAKIQALIEELKAKKFEDADKFKELQHLLSDLFNQDDKMNSLGFDSAIKFAYFNSLKKFLDTDYAKKLTFEILDQLKPLKVIGWREKESVLKEMRVKVKDILFQKKIEIKDAQKIAITIIDLTRMHPDE